MAKKPITQTAVSWIFHKNEKRDFDAVVELFFCLRVNEENCEEFEFFIRYVMKIKLMNSSQTEGCTKTNELNV